jgi:hypothetical protein
MARGQRNVSGFTRRARRGNTALSVGAAVAAFGLVLAAMFLAFDSGESEVKPAAIPVENPLKAEPVSTNSEPKHEPLEISFGRRSIRYGEEAENTIINLDEVFGPEEVSPADQVKAHAEAGEFGLAIQVAQKIADVRERAVLLKVLADTQLEAGEFAGAMQAIQRIPIPQLRGEARGERALQEALAGGGSMADFTQLIDLIQNETSGPWEDLDGTGGSISQYDTGVRVDPNGQLAMLTQQDYEGRLEDMGLRARQADLNEDMAQPSGMRVVSLTRLEAEIARRMEQGQPVLTTMQHLAGLSAVKYVFVDPQTREIMIAGPAEGWEYNQAGIPVGVSSGVPTLQLDDLVTVMRIFSPSGNQFFNCLIVPRKEGLRKLSEFVERSNARGALRPGAPVRNFANKCQEELGLQDAVFNGVPTDSRVARVMLEADYRMKLIGIDKLDAGPNIPSYFDLLTPQLIQLNPPKLDALRWWMTMKYDAVLHPLERASPATQMMECVAESAKTAAKRRKEIAPTVRSGKGSTKIHREGRRPGTLRSGQVDLSSSVSFEAPRSTTQLRLRSAIHLKRVPVLRTSLLVSPRFPRPDGRGYFMPPLRGCRWEPSLPSSTKGTNVDESSPMSLTAYTKSTKSSRPTRKPQRHQ